MKFKAGNHALSCVGATPGCQSVLVGSSSLALWSVVLQKRLAKFMGHSVSATFCLATIGEQAGLLPAKTRKRQQNSSHSCSCRLQALGFRL